MHKSPNNSNNEEEKKLYRNVSPTHKTDFLENLQNMEREKKTT